jgi:subtilisin family serine protease
MLASGSYAGQPAAIEQKVRDEIAANGQSTVWVVLREQADLAPAFQIKDWKRRGEFVYHQLVGAAARTQPALHRALQQRNVPFKPVWIVNAIQVTGDQATVDALAAEPAVWSILATRSYSIPQPIAGQPQQRTSGVEWNLDRIGAPWVWANYGRGEGIVVCNIDTGVQFDHPALINQYRGNLGGGSFDHNYSWYDPSQTCGSPSMVPCDNNGHGTHTMGTMVGNDGLDNQIGVAPGARWIAAKGCESSSCSGFALTACAQWILAPTDLEGNNPRPDLRPHVVNNSWGGGQGDGWYQWCVQAWVAAGIFPAFSVGNSGSSCWTANSPGDYPESYASGAFDYWYSIAWFSSRGPSCFGPIKPNLAAPGVDVRSSVPYNGYAWYSGTSMASPHTAATVALVWSAAPALVGDVAVTRALLDQTAVDTPDWACGGFDQNNNVWGEGRLDAAAAVFQAPKGPVGALQGTVTDAVTGIPMAAVQVGATGPMTRTNMTDGAGLYAFPALSVGSYDVTVSIFGYLPQTAAGVVVSEGATTVQDFALTPSPAYSVSGYVYEDDGAAVPNATVMITGTPIPPAVTGPDGAYTFASVPEGNYFVLAMAGGCNDPAWQFLSVWGGPATAFNFILPRRMDAFGYYCRLVSPSYIEADEKLSFYGDDGSQKVELPFQFTFYGKTYNQAWISLNGFLTFFEAGSSYLWNECIPVPWVPNAAIYAFWDDMFVSSWDFPPGEVRTDTLGTMPNRQFVVEWRNLRRLGYWDQVFDVEIVLNENGHILTQYRNVPLDPVYRGNQATLGLENENGTIGFLYSCNQELVTSPTMAVLYRVPPSAFVQGVVTDFNDARPIQGAKVRLLLEDVAVREANTDAAGFYRLQARVGTDYTIEATANNYETASAKLDLTEEDTTYTQDFVLRTAQPQVSPGALEFVVPAGERRTKTLTLANTGSSTMVWTLRETGARQVAEHPGTGIWLYKAEEGIAMTANWGSDPGARLSRAAKRNEIAMQGDYGLPTMAYPAAFAWQAAEPTADLKILVYADDYFHGAPYTFLDQALQRLGLSYRAHYNGDWYGFEASLAGGAWDIVLIGNDNYGPPESALNALSNYVAGGGKLVIHCWTVEFNPASSLWQALGFQFGGSDYDPPNPVWWWDPTHPIFSDPQSVPEFLTLSGYRYGIYGQFVEPMPNFTALAGYMTPGPAPSQAALILGNDGRTVFKGFLDGQNDADRDGDGTQDGVELWINLISGIQTGFPTDVAWLSEDVTSGTLEPGQSQTIGVTADASALTPGVYAAILVIPNNSARQPVLKVPVKLLVSAYIVGVNAGGGAYTDSEGELWHADKAFANSGWGYIGKPGTPSTKKAIGGTEDDPLYQDACSGAFDYRFDVPVRGTYEVELRFAEIQNLKAGQRQFDVILEGTTVLPAHDVVAESGGFTADNHRLRLFIADGQVNLRFVIRRSFKDPILNAVRVIHRPDL